MTFKKVQESKEIGKEIVNGQEVAILQPEVHREVKNKKTGVDYDSEEALTLGSDVMQCINDAARDVSINLAKDRGAYPGWQVTEMDPNPIRNATRTCIAPTGTISAIAGASS